MALKAGYVGIKSQLMQSLRDKLLKLDGIIPAGASSDNPLATESEINDLWEVNAKTGVHNILPFPYKTGSTTSGGVSVVVNNDETLTVTTPDGPSTATYDFVLFGTYGSTADLIGAGHYIGSIGNTNSKITIRGAYASTDLGNAVDNWDVNAEDGISFICIRFESGLNLDSAITLKPQLCYAIDKYAGRTPYAMTNEELTKAVTGWKEATLGTPSSGSLVSANSKVMYNDDLKLLSIVLQINGNEADASIHIGKSISTSNNALIGIDGVDNTPAVCLLSGGLLTIKKACSVFRLCQLVRIPDATAALTRTTEDPAEEPAATKKTTRSKKTVKED